MHGLMQHAPDDLSLIRHADRNHGIPRSSRATTGGLLHCYIYSEEHRRSRQLRARAPLLGIKAGDHVATLA
ncbi:MAG: hypothetical protein M5R42_01565 [Rhodocyclaceae bacterium]|nr:hypothetical protein [Rhodocyclaceae bacterium]